MLLLYKAMAPLRTLGDSHTGTWSVLREERRDALRGADRSWHSAHTLSLIMSGAAVQLEKHDLCRNSERTLTHIGDVDQIELACVRYLKVSASQATRLSAIASILD